MSDVSYMTALGDVFVNRPNPREVFDGVKPLFEASVLKFANCEGIYTDRPDLAPSCGFRVASPWKNLGAFDDVVFDVMTLANNHMIDAGHQAFVEMLDELRGRGMNCIGAGRNLAEARAPAIVDVAGTKVGFLSYTTIYQAGYQARANVPGVSALRVHSVPYFPDWDPYGRLEPGAQPHVRTFPEPEDMDLLEAAIVELKSKTDIVIVSLHWGDSRLPIVLTDYEKTIGRFAIEKGADAILGHHHHFLKAVEFHLGKPILYGLGHFAFDLLGLEAVVGPKDCERLRDFSEWAIFPRNESPGYPFHADTRHTGAALLAIRDRKIDGVFFAPFHINADNQTVHPASAGGPDETTLYLQSATRQVGFATRFDEGPKFGPIQTWACLPPAD
jgi:poly-gamma-glutamate synthesis protein (capsule biosynthesis protein)